MPDNTYGYKDQARYLEHLKKPKAAPTGTVTRSGLSSAVAGTHGFDPGGSLRDNVKIPGIADVLKRNYEVAALYHGSVDNSERKVEGSNSASRELDDLGRYIAWRAGADYIAGPLKGSASLMKKLLFDYGGNVGSLKDVVRCTIVGDSVAVYENICAVIKAHCTRENNYTIIKNARVDPNTDACGYSGANIVVTLPCKLPGEIQVNIPAVMYGKFPEEDYIPMLNTDLAKYHKLERAFKVEGGLGHILYKVNDKNKGEDVGRKAAALSKRYYAYFRLFPKSSGESSQLQADIDAFKSTHAASIHAAEQP